MDWESDSRQLDEVLKHVDGDRTGHKEDALSAFEGYQVLADFDKNLEVL